MTKEQKTFAAGSLPVFIIGLLLLGVVFFVPNFGQPEDKSFLEVARQARWDELGDWNAAWCSLKIILFSLGVFCLLLFFWTVLMFSTPKSLDWFFLLLIALPCVLFWVGVYYLIKAVF